MKRIAICALVCSWLASTPAYADANSGSGSGATRASACQAAKNRASGPGQIGYGSRVTGYSVCDCSAVVPSGPNSYWTCTVDVFYIPAKE